MAHDNRKPLSFKNELNQELLRVSISLLRNQVKIKKKQGTLSSWKHNCEILKIFQFEEKRMTEKDIKDYVLENFSTKKETKLSHPI